MRFLGALLILATLFSGCVSATHKKEPSNENAACSNAAVKIKAIVIEHLGERANEVMQTDALVCFLAFKDPEYVLIQKMLTMDKVRFEYDTVKNAMNKKEDVVQSATGRRGVILSVYVERISNGQAIAHGEYSRGSHFSRFRYTLIYGNRKWKIVDAKFTMAS
jgi:hypothetical protein